VFFGAQRLASVFRLASTGAAPNLRLAGTGAKYTDPRPARREPKLRLADARSNSLARTDSGAPNSARLPLAGGRAAKLNFAHSSGTLRSRGSALGPSPLSGSAARPGKTPKLNFAADRSRAIGPRPRPRKSPGKGWLDAGRRKPPTARRATPGKGWLRPARRPRPNWYSNGPTTGWIRRSRAKDRWRTRRRSLSGSLLSTVRDLLPTGDRR
jgi:hypothetical protein